MAEPPEPAPAYADGHADRAAAAATRAGVQLAADCAMQLPDSAFIWSCVGGQQGDGHATHFCCAPAHEALHAVQKLHPTTRIVCFADDTTFNDAPERLYGADGTYSTMLRTQLERNGHTSNLTKVEVYSPEGDMALAPPELRGPDGTRPRGRAWKQSSRAGCGRERGKVEEMATPMSSFVQKPSR